MRCRRGAPTAAASSARRVRSRTGPSERMMNRITVEFAWQPIGHIRLEGGRPAFPTLEERPGIYRFTFEWADRPPGVYIGETDRLRRRAQLYRTPGPTLAREVGSNLPSSLQFQLGSTVRQRWGHDIQPAMAPDVTYAEALEAGWPARRDSSARCKPFVSKASRSCSGCFEPRRATAFGRGRASWATRSKCGWAIGWSANPSALLETYSHAVPAMQTEAADLIAVLIDAAG